MTLKGRTTVLLLQNAPLLLFIVLLLVFASLSDRFLTPGTARNVIIQAAPIAILAIGMTFVLLTAQIDLSIGGSMYVAACIVALYAPALPWPFALIVMMLTGALIGVINGLIITRLGIASFVATLAGLFILRGLAWKLSETKTLFFADAIIDLNRVDFLGVPSAVAIFLVVFAVAWITLTHTPFGRQVYAVGEDAEAARKAGLPVRSIVFTCFVLCGLCAGIGSFVTITQIGAAGPKYGDQIEFQAVAAAVLGGVSLFGGRGSVAGTVFGALLVKTTYAGLNIINANPYSYPLVIAGIIFLAVAVDGLRTRMLERLERRTIRPMAE